MKYYLYNALSNNGIKPDYFTPEMHIVEAVGLDYPAFFASLKPEDEVVLIGGDGTINYFINAVDTDSLQNNVYLLSGGTGNDFLTDIEGNPREEILINRYIKDLPTVTVNGITRKFINGIGYGIDGYCCEEADRIKAKNPNAKLNYTAYAVKGLLFAFKPRRAEVTVDGITTVYPCTWLAPAMKGRYFGGGMKIAPDQNRRDKLLTTVAYTGRSKIKSLMLFPKIFTGEHVTHTDMVFIRVGKTIEVHFDNPCALQIDGETILNVSSYIARA